MPDPHPARRTGPGGHRRLHCYRQSRSAVSFIRELRSQCQRIAANPPGYRLRPEPGDGIRSCAHGHYVIFFVATAEEVAIIRVLHGGRDIPAILIPDDSGQ